MTKLRVLDLFSGMGGFSLGLEDDGAFETVAFCEIDPSAQQVLAHHWPDVPCLPDVETAEFPSADFLTAGFPCQDISLAGAGAGLAGARSGLYRHVIRALRLVRPIGAVLENVAALLSRGMGTVLGDLAEIGYDAEWHCIPASAVGAPHRRDRVWIIADARSEQHEVNRPPFSGALAKELSQAAAHADSERELQPQGSLGNERGRLGDGRWWASEPDVGRVAYGVPNGVDRMRLLGNAVVPFIPKIIGRAFHASRSVKSASMLEAAE